MSSARRVCVGCYEIASEGHQVGQERFDLGGTPQHSRVLLNTWIFHRIAEFGRELLSDTATPVGIQHDPKAGVADFLELFIPPLTMRVREISIESECHVAR